MSLWLIRPPLKFKKLRHRKFYTTSARGAAKTEKEKPTQVTRCDILSDKNYNSGYEF